MSTTTQNIFPPRLNLFIPRMITAMVIGFMLAFALLGAAVITFQLQHEGRIYPGVSVSGMDLSGVSPNEAAAKLAETFTYPATGSMAFQDGSTVWVASPAELGLSFDAAATAQVAYQAGRTGGLLNRFFTIYSLRQEGRDISPQLVYNEYAARLYLEGLAEKINRSTIEATLGLTGAEVVVNSGQIGRILDIDATMGTLAPQLQSMTDGLVPLKIDETPPVIFDATAQAEIAREILSAPLVITLPSEETGTWQIEPETLAGMLSIERVVKGEEDAEYRIGLDSEQLESFVTSIAPGLAISPVNARYIFNDDTRELEVIAPSVTGRAVLIDETVAAINKKLSAGEHSIEVVFDYILPTANNDTTAADLGITELVSTHTSYFYGSSGSRVHNIQTGASQFHGLLLAPGETLSMAEILGDISLDTGYAEALIIYGDRTIEGVGGGICQVSTTLFRTAFFGGFEINERYSHAYRVYYYELAPGGGINQNMAGLDATVFIPLVDFKFTNDSEHWLLMETYSSSQSLTWKFYSTNDGRTVEWTTTGLRNRAEAPDPLYIENAALSKGEVRQVDWAVEGADVTVTRTVIRNSETINEDVFSTHYVPWRSIFEYGPGTKGIPPDEG